MLYITLDILNNNVDLSSLNNTHIVLIPKINNPKHTQDFKPISFCNVIFKIIKKTTANRLKNVLLDIIHIIESAIVLRRLSIDNTLITFETFHSIKQRRKGTKDYFALKLNMSKTYNRVEWNFFEGMVCKMGFLNA